MRRLLQIATDRDELRARSAAHAAELATLETERTGQRSVVESLAVRVSGIQEENLVENSRVVGEHLLKQIDQLAKEFPKLLSNSRGRGLFCAMDLDTAQNRDQLRSKAYEAGLILIGCGDRTIRFRPPLNLRTEEVDEGVTIIRKALKELEVGE